mgnify:FL=1
MEEARLNIVDRIHAKNRDAIELGPNGRMIRHYFPSRRRCSERILKELGVDPGYRVGNEYYQFFNETVKVGDDELPLRLRNVTPPQGVHWIGWSDGAFFDPMSSDLFEESLARVGVELKPGMDVVDFGCSSGRTVRTLWAAFPDVKWHGIDPVESSIEYARATFPGISFVLNDFQPPLPGVKEASYDAGCAFSIWSHFDASLAKDWLAEMARVFRPGGVFVVSVHGYGDVVQRVRLPPGQHIAMSPDFAETVLNALDREGFFFDTTLMPEKRTVIKGEPQWGSTWIAPNWMRQAASECGWTVVDVTYGRWGHRQDLFVLRR